MSVIAAIQELLLNDVWIDDAVDRFNRKYMVTLMLFFLGLITVGQFVRGDEIQCYSPPYLSDMQSEYALSICWTKGTTTLYPKGTKSARSYEADAVAFQRMLRPEDARPDSLAHDARFYVGPHHAGESVPITYYQWIPLILALMALLFHAPYILWNVFVRGSGVPLKSLVSAAKEASSVQPDGGTRDGYVNDIVYRLTAHLERGKRRRRAIICGKSFLYLMYLFVKTLYLGSVSACLLLLYAFCGQNEYFSVWHHGVWVAKRLVLDYSWPQSPLFPLETQCTFLAERQGAPHAHVMQCAMPLNLYNDKIFAIFSILFPLVFLLNLVSLIRWTWNNSYFGRKDFVRDHVDEEAEAAPAASITRFAEDVLGRDGCFVLQVIRINVGDFVVDRVMTRMWNNFKDRDPIPGSEADFLVPGAPPPPTPPQDNDKRKPSKGLLEIDDSGEKMGRGFRSGLNKLLHPSIGNNKSVLL